MNERAQTIHRRLMACFLLLDVTVQALALRNKAATGPAIGLLVFQVVWLMVISTVVFVKRKAIGEWFAAEFVRRHSAHVVPVPCGPTEARSVHPDGTLGWVAQDQEIIFVLREGWTATVMAVDSGMTLDVDHSHAFPGGNQVSLVITSRRTASAPSLMPMKSVSHEPIT